MKRCWYQAAIRAKSKRLCGIIPGIKTAVRETRQFSWTFQIARPSQRCVGFIMRNTYATCTQHGVLRDHAMLYFTVFCAPDYSRDVKKVELHLKDWLSQKCAEEARNIVNYSVAWPRNTPCCVDVAYVLRMTKRTQRCK